MSSRWLFRQGALILGPLDQEQLAQKILEGELGEDTEVKELGGEAFRPLRGVGVFAVALEKAKAKRRVEVLAEKRAALKRKRRFIAAVGVLVLLLASSVAVSYISTDLAKSKTTESTDSLAFAGFSSDIVSIHRSAKAPPKEKDILLTYQDSKSPTGVRRSVVAEGGNKGGGGGAWMDDMVTDIQWNPDSIKQVLSANERRLLSCLQNNVKTTDGWNRGDLVKIPIGFTIANNGRVNNLWVEHARYKGKSLESCLLQEMGKWPFAPYDGDQAVVNWSIAWKVRS